MKIKKPKLEDYVRQIIETFGPTNKCFGGLYRLNFNEDDLRVFLGTLKKDKVKFKLFNQSVMFFSIHMKAIYSLIDKDITKTNNIIEGLYPHVWSKLALSIIFSIINEITKEPYKSFRQFLLDDFKPIRTKRELEKIYNTYNKNYPSITKILGKFYEDYLDKDDKNRIIKGYMPEEKKKLKSIKEIIGDMYGRMRSGFLHNMGMTIPFHRDATFSLGRKYIKISENLSLSQFLFYSWKAIFRFFGYEKNIESKFTEEEIKNGRTLNGKSLSFPF